MTLRCCTNTTAASRNGLANLQRRLPRRLAPVAALMMMLIITVTYVAGCGNTSRPASSGTPAGMYTLTVTAKSGTAARSTTVTLIVQ